MGVVLLSKIPLVADKGLKGLLKRAAVLGVLLVAFGAGGIAAHLAVLSRDLPDLSSMEDYQPPVTSKVFDANGNLVARFYEERRTVVPIEKIPKHVRQAFISAEDEDFYTHGGVDYLAIVRCTLNRFIGGTTCGGSTITQQTAKTFLLSSERSYSRKMKELLLSKRIEERFSKDDILFLYLNQIYFGNGAYGIEEAARTYYGVGVDKLSLAQAAALASVPKSPNRINPWADPKRVRARRGYVLGQMKQNGLITAEQEEKAKQEPVRIDVEAPEFLDTAPYYAEAIRRELMNRKDIGPDDVTRGGLTVYAALDARMQKAANEAVQRGLRDLDKRQGYRGPLARLDPDEAKDLSALFDDERARRFPAEETPELKQDALLGRPIWDLKGVSADALKKALAAIPEPEEEDEADSAAKQGAPEPKSAPPLRGVRTQKAKLGAIVGAAVKKVDGPSKTVTVDLGTVDAVMPFSSMSWARPFNPERGTEKPKNVTDVLKKGDVVLVRLDKVVAATKKEPQHLEVALEQTPKVEAALVAIDPSTHRVLSLVGGYDFERSSFNRATQARRQAGSSFKPFIYGTGIETKLFSPVGFLEQVTNNGASHYEHRLITDAPKVFFDRWTGQKWQPKNSGGRFLGDITTRTCLTHSVNTCSISILERVGVDPVIELAEKVKLSTKEHAFPKNLTLALGTGEVVPIDLVNAYTIFPAEGRFAPPVLIEKVKRPNGQVVEEARAPDPVQAISPESAFIMSDMMKSVVESGTATRARDLGRPVAGKTGTTDEARSVWFVGFTPDVVAGVYVGFDDNEPLGKNESGGRAAVPIWLDFMKVATAELPVRDFAPPASVVRKSIDSATGLLARAGDGLVPGTLPEPQFNDDGDPIPKELPQGIIAEVFAQGTEPTMTADDAPPPPLELLEKGGLGP